MIMGLYEAVILGEKYFLISSFLYILRKYLVNVFHDILLIGAQKALVITS